MLTTFKGLWRDGDKTQRHITLFHTCQILRWQPYGIKKEVSGRFVCLFVRLHICPSIHLNVARSMQRKDKSNRTLHEIKEEKKKEQKETPRLKIRK